MFWKRKKAGRPVEGPRPDLDLPEGNWSHFALAFHERTNQVVSVIMADDEAVLGSLPRVQHGQGSRRKGRIYREDKALGCRFDTDTESDRGYTIRNAGVRMPVSEEERAAYASLFQAWGARHAGTGAIRRFEDEDGVQFCWKVGDNDVIGVRVEHLGSDINFWATRAWVIGAFREQFEASNAKQSHSLDAKLPNAKKQSLSAASANSVFLSLMPVRSGAQEHPYSTREPHRDNTSELANLLEKMRLREPFDRRMLPQQLAKIGQIHVEQSALSTGFLLLDHQAADVFRQHDLGEGFLWEMPVVGRDGTQIADEYPWFGLYVGAVKDTLDLAASTGVKKAFGNRTLDTRPLEIGEKHLVLSAQAKSGPDVWREQHLSGDGYFFLSSNLKDALHAADLESDFNLIGCATNL